MKLDDPAGTAFRSDELLRLLADNLPALIAYYSARDFLCEFANTAYARTYGRDTGSIIGKSVGEIVGADAYRLIKPHIDRAMQGETVHYERPLTFPDGTRGAIEVSLIPHLDPDG